jgi:SAM-dependent methyltransferase
MMTFQKAPSEFKAVLGQVRWHDALYKFLQNIYRLYPEDRFHALIKTSTQEFDTDEAIYRHIQRQLPSIKPFHADFTYALPSLFKQKKEMARQTLDLLGSKRNIDGYVEIGSTGRYISELRKHIDITGNVTLVNDLAPNNSPADIMERGGLRKIGVFNPLSNYEPLALTDSGFDLVTCYIGLHHIPLDRLDPFISSFASALKPRGIFILRDHDVISDEMNTFVSLIHTIFNAGLGVPWETNHSELRFFRPVVQWEERLQAHGLQTLGKRLLQPHDPSDNMLMAFVKGAA